MYSKQEAAAIKQQFWTSLGQYLHPIPSAKGIKVNWLNYHTGVPNCFFRMRVLHQTACIGIELTHRDADMRQLVYDLLVPLRPMLEAATAESWTWIAATSDEQGKTISRIFIEKHGLNMMRTTDWPELISFFKPRMVALDAFWAEAYDIVHMQL